MIGPISHLTALKKEMARVLDGYESVEDSEYVPYEQSDTAGIRREPPPAESWKDDLGEYSRRIWEWWLLRWLHVKEFEYFGEAIRKVVLVKTSSALVERDFSQFVAVTNSCGTNLKYPSMQNRIFLRCNKQVYEDESEAIDAGFGGVE